MEKSLTQRFGFLVKELAGLYSQQFDREARERLGLSQAQCRLLFVLASHDEEEPLSQAALAEKVGVSAMAITTMCDRLAAGGWVERRPSPHDRRVNRLHMQPKARKALERALALGDELTDRMFAGFSAPERKQLIALLGRARESLLAIAREKAAA
jgi:DNA-binding MarR family transcriptional regulator